jgi:hypothetical protein
MQRCLRQQQAVFKEASPGEKQKYPLLYCSNTAWEKWCEVDERFMSGDLLVNGRIPNEGDGLTVILQQITKNDLTWLLGMRDEDICLATDMVLANKVSVKTMKVKGSSDTFPTLTEWAWDMKCDRAVMNEIMFIVKKHPLPAKDKSYIPYSSEQWSALETELKISRTTVTNLRKEIWKDEKNRKFFYCKHGACRMNATCPSGCETRLEVTALIDSVLDVDSGPTVPSTGRTYKCISAESLEDMVSKVDTEKPLGDTDYLPVLFMYSADDRDLEMPEGDVIDLVLSLSLADRSTAEVSKPVRPTLWICSMHSRDYLVELMRVADEHRYCFTTVLYVPAPENRFQPSRGESSPLITFNYSCPEGVRPGNERFTNFTGLPRTLSPVLSTPSSSAGGMNWSGNACHVSLSTLEDFLTPLVKASKSTTLLNFFGGGNITNIGLV